MSEWPPEDGVPYMPSNGSEGDIFESQWCNHCVAQSEYMEGDFEKGCGIIFRAMCGEQPPEWKWQGRAPACTEFEEVD